MVDQNKILLGHGGGGRLSRALIENEIVTRFGKGALKGLPDGASLTTSKTNIVFSTDSFVVQPLEFPGGNIGELAVYGTINDVAVCGATPKWLSLALILEEGLDIELLRRILDTIKVSADKCNVEIVTGDTKVVKSGQCDGLYINTAGIGESIAGFNLGVDKITQGDCVISSGTLGEHGMAIMATRLGMAVGDSLVSDCAPVDRLVRSLSEFASGVRFMRDPTRGGAAAVLNEIVEDTPNGISLKESDLPFSKSAAAVAEVVGMDLLHVASEGRLLAVCAKEVADSIVTKWRQFEEGEGACIIGCVTEDAGRVILETEIGGRRLVDVPNGELLPRIC